MGTPCADWTVRDLVDHLVREQLWAPELLAGCTVEQVGDRFDGDRLGVDPRHSWVLAASAAREAWIEPDALAKRVRLSSGEAGADEYGWQMTLDLTVHAWDLATAVGADRRVDAGLAEAVLAFAEREADAWSGSGLFADPVPVGADADAQTRLVALLGRRP
ncbi:TIGR03086 family metal-binding protein [Actinosynnema pretiosum]|uniref:TIGR03086 family protein n=1 Tax=Actinosynnema pretiosum TaxID=42197 RepID=A0A290Z406_9PSEU|nr:TIGR03086 family metal-binding protein [Actinosynnema pretiosum]ATE53714.1 TIGR03086 family protein [Actinosynnema pretiosum]